MADRDEQFDESNAAKKDFKNTGDPVISTDTKKKEMVGENARDGVCYASGQLDGPDHNFGALDSAFSAFGAFGALDGAFGAFGAPTLIPVWAIWERCAPLSRQKDTIWGDVAAAPPVTFNAPEMVSSKGTLEPPGNAEAEALRPQMVHLSMI